MGGVAILFSVLILATVLLCHRVSSTAYEDAKLSAGNSLIVEKEIYGRYYYKTKGIPLRCCLTFKKDVLCLGEIPTFKANCACNFVYQNPSCTEHRYLTRLTEGVQNRNGSAVIFTPDDRDEAARRYASSSLTIPIILLTYDKSMKFYRALNEEFNLTAEVEISQDDPGNGLNNGRSATTFYFVVFAFTILLLLSLTWFVFNYLRRCHHMYTVKRQRVSTSILMLEPCLCAYN